MQYPYIAAWAVKTGSHEYYWDGVRDKAIKEHAPSDAVFTRQDGRWVCMHHLPQHIRPYLHKLVNLFERCGK
jgi:hypothetical protein